MIAVDTKTSKLLLSEDIDNKLKPGTLNTGCASVPRPCKVMPEITIFCARMDRDTLTRLEKQFKVTFEKRDKVLKVLAWD